LGREQLLMKELEERVEQNNLELRVVHEERPQEICFRPSSPAVYPVRRILERIEYVMEVDVHPRRETGQHLCEEVIDVAPDFCHVRRIDKENIAASKPSEQIERDVLDPLPHDLNV